MKTSTLHQSLQAKLGSYAGEHLVTTLRYQDQYGNSVEKPLLESVLHKLQGNQSHAAQVLGINRNTLRKKMKAHGIKG